MWRSLPGFQGLEIIEVFRKENAAPLAGARRHRNPY